MMDDFVIKEDGTLVRKQQSDIKKTPEDLEKEQISLLEYEVFVHPERCSPQELEEKKKRLDELWQKYGKADNSVLALHKAKKRLELLDKEKSSGGNSVLMAAIARHKKSLGE